MSCESCDGELPPGARFCPSCGTPSTPSAATAAEEERKLVSVVFCDLVGSTALSERLDPETLRAVTLRYFAAMRAPIEEFGGTVEKFIGDAVMAVFGVPAMHEDDAHRAAAAALGMIEALARLNAELEASLRVRLRVRIGVNTGPAVTGADVSARQALVSGETVNVAARLEQHAGEGEILIGPATRRAVGPAARTESVGPLRLKGKEAPVTAYRLLGIGEDTPELTRRFDLPFVGRAQELAALDAALDAVDGGGGGAGSGARLVTVYGEPGIGKTRLVRTWLDRAGRPERAVALGVGRCRPYGERGSLAPLADAVHQLLAGPAGPDARRDAAALAVLEHSLLRDGTPGPSPDATRRALGRLLAEASRERPVVLALDDAHWASDPLLDLIDRLIDQPIDVPANVPTDVPINVPISLPTGADGGSGVLFVCLARLDLLDRRPVRTDGPRLSLVVPPLSATECETVAAGWAEVGAHLSGDSSRLAEQAGGNPFHLEQLLAAADEADRADELPHTLQALLGARLDALGRAERAALELAAVLGREFVPSQVAALADAGPEGARGGPLDALADGDQGNDPGIDSGSHPGSDSGSSDPGGDPGRDPVLAALARLIRRRLVEPSGASASAPTSNRRRAIDEPVRFSSGLAHEATYQAMAKRTRADRHERTAALLTAWHAPDASIAGHLESAYRYRGELGVRDAPTEALRRRAAALFTAAGAQALTRSDLAWAETLLGRAVALLAPGDQEEPGKPGAGKAGEPGEPGEPGTPSERGQQREPGWDAAARQLGETRIAAGRVEEGRALLRAVLDAPSRPVEAAHAALTLAVDDPGGEPGAAARAARRALPVFEAAGDELGQARAAVRMAQEQQLLGRHGRAAGLLDKALAHAARCGAEPELALTLGAVGVSLWRGPTPVPAAVDRCRELLAEYGGPRPGVRVTLACPLAVLYALGEQWDEARARLAEAERAAGELGYAESAIVLPVFAAAVEALAQRPERALDLLGEAGAAAHRLAAGGMAGMIAREQARVLTDCGRSDEAADRLAAMGPSAHLLRSDTADLDGLRARLAARNGDAAAALGLARRAVSAAAGTDSPVVRALAAFDQAAVWEQLGRPDDAAAALGSAVRSFEDKGHLAGLRLAGRMQARLDAGRDADRDRDAGRNLAADPDAGRGVGRREPRREGDRA